MISIQIIISPANRLMLASAIAKTNHLIGAQPASHYTLKYRAEQESKDRFVGIS